MQSFNLHPSDVAVALELAALESADRSPAALGYRGIAARIGLSHGEVHNAVRRLRTARLVRADVLQVEPSPLIEFLVHGVRYAFAAELGPVTRGVLTGPSAKIVALSFTSDMEPIVWPSADGSARGAALTPLVPSAPQLPGTNQALYELLALVDALRVGRARERRLAEEILTARIRGQRATAEP